MGVSMGAAIRQLKLEISSVDIDLPEQDVSIQYMMLCSLVLNVCARLRIYYALKSTRIYGNESS